MKKKCQIGWKTLREKEKLLVTSNFSFSHNVFHSYISLEHKNAVLCGNGLIHQICRKYLSQVGLHSPPRLTKAETFCFQSIFYMAKDSLPHNAVVCSKMLVAVFSFSRCFLQAFSHGL